MTKSKVPWLGLFSPFFICILQNTSNQIQYFSKNFLPLKNIAWLLVNTFCVFVNLWQRGGYLRCHTSLVPLNQVVEIITLQKRIENTRNMGAVSPGFLGELCIHFWGCKRSQFEDALARWPLRPLPALELQHHGCSCHIGKMIFISMEHSKVNWLPWEWKQWVCPLHLKLSQLK